jgi:hypothetical protein
VPVRFAVIAALAGFMTAGSEARAQLRAAAKPAALPTCRVTSVAERALVVGGRAVYVEPQAFIASGSRLLLAGTPVFVWGDSSGVPVLLRRDSVIGVVIDASGRARLLAPPRPLAGRFIHDVRAAPAKAGEWAVAFAEGEPMSYPPRDPQVTAYWFGITNGARWRALERLPMTPARPRSGMASALARTARGFALAVPIQSGTPDAPRYDILVIDRDGRRLNSEVVGTPWAVAAALSPDGVGGLLLGVVQPDPREREDHSSLLAYRRPRGMERWQPLGRLVRGLGQPVHDPRIDVTAAGVVVTWHAKPAGLGEGRAIIVDSLGGPLPTPVTLGAPALEVLTAPTRGAPVWVLATLADSASRRVRILTRTGGHVALVFDEMSPFGGPIAAASVGGRVVVTGGVAARRPGEVPVHSRLLSVRWRCGGAR